MAALFGVAVMTLGAAFLALGGLGLWRMPDTLSRIQAGTKATTLGTILTLGGAALVMPAWGIKLALVTLFLMFSNPLSSQVLARAVQRGKGAAVRSDALAADEDEGKSQ